jgi:hypothetical protein
MRGHARRGKTMIKHDSSAKFRQQKKTADDMALGYGCLFSLVGAGGAVVLIGILLGREVIDPVCPATGGGLLGFIVGGVAAIILGVVSSPKYYLHSGGYKSEPIDAKRYNEITRRQKDIPCLVMQIDSRTWWWFQDEIYWENESFNALEVKALILERKRRRERQIRRAIALMEQEGAGAV